MKNLGNILKQAQQMQGQMAKMQEQMATMEITGAAGGGMVEITMNGKNEVRKVRIDPAAVDTSDMEMLEDLIAAAFNDARAKVQAMTEKEMAGLAGGLNIPGLKLPF